MGDTRPRMAGDDRRREPRKPVGLLVRLKHPDVGAFVASFATNISANGMQIRTRAPKPVGTVVRFDIQIAEGQRVMRGEAIVRWARTQDSEDGPPGMGLEFTELDEATRAIVNRMVMAQMLSGASPTPPSPSPADPAPPADMAGPPPPPPDAIDIDAAALVADTPETQDLDDDFSIDIDLDDDFDIDLDVSDEADEAEIDVEVGDVEEEAPQVPLIFLDPPAVIPQGGPVIGIDLGTTNSCVAFHDGKKAAVIQSKEGYNTIPSVVALSRQKKLFVGHRAKGQLLTNPERTVYGAKRLVGRQFASSIVEAVADRFHYPVCADMAGRAAVKLGDDVVSLEEIQGLVLAEAKSMAEEHLGQPIHRAVITVPAYYSDAQRQAVREAGRLAGLRVERILNEPTAAALAYGLNRELKKKVLIYDLGGGTFDATVMDIYDNVFEVLGTGGDTFLGGVDFDNHIVDLLLEKFQETTGHPFAGDRVALSRLADAAERAKIALSESLSHDLMIPFLMMSPSGAPLDLECTLTRAELDEILTPLVDRTLDTVRDVLLDANLKPSEVEDVILVGGQSRAPIVRQKLKEMFGRDPHPGVHADEAVAIGAALLASSLDKVTSVVLIDVLPMTIGVGLPGGRFHRIIERNSPLPVEKTYGIATSRDDQKVIEVSVFQGEDIHIAGNEYLGTAKLSGLPKGPKRSVRVAVTFSIGQDGILAVRAREMKTGKEVVAKLATRGTSEDIRKKLKVKSDAAQEAERRHTGELATRSGKFWGLFKRALGR